MAVDRWMGEGTIISALRPDCGASNGRQQTVDTVERPGLPQQTAIKFGSVQSLDGSGKAPSRHLSTLFCRDYRVSSLSERLSYQQFTAGASAMTVIYRRTERMA